MAYQASAVLIETDDAPRPALPVQTRNLYVLPFRHPTIERVIAQSGENAPIVSLSTLVIEGKQLRGDVTTIVIGGAEFAPPRPTSRRSASRWRCPRDCGPVSRRCKSFTRS